MSEIGSIVRSLGQSAGRASRTLDDWTNGLATDDEAMGAIELERNVASDLFGRTQRLRTPCIAYGSMHEDLQDSLRNYRTALDHVVIAIRDHDSAAMNMASTHQLQAMSELTSAGDAYSSLHGAIPNCEVAS